MMSVAQYLGWDVTELKPVSILLYLFLILNCISLLCDMLVLLWYVIGLAGHVGIRYMLVLKCITQQVMGVAQYLD